MTFRNQARPDDPAPPARRVTITRNTDRPDTVTLDVDAQPVASMHAVDLLEELAVASETLYLILSHGTWKDGRARHDTDPGLPE